MKKFYFLASALLAITTLKAQTTVDFEDLTLAADSFYNGSDEAGGFVSGGVTFGNDYTTAFDSWEGFAYSNMTDNTTAGYGNQYSAYPASGADNSDNYAVYFNGDTLHFPGTHANLVSVDFTNTTYAYLSMRDGDAYAKQFGSSNNANGDDDGTNGEDYFYVTVFNHDATGNKTDSLNFYLADFRFTDANDDFIVDSWENLDLSALKNVNFLTFTFNSSDVGDFGINTPQYFAIDNLVYENTTGLNSMQKADFAMYPNPAQSTLNIEGDAGEYRIYNTSGSLVKEFNNFEVSTVDISALAPGIYVVKVSTGTAVDTRKLIVR